MSRLAWIPLLALFACDGGHTDTHEHDHDCHGCNLDTAASSEGDSFYVTYAMIGDEVVVNDDFDLTVTVHDGADVTTLLADATVVVDAGMPAHGHGMNVVPTVTANGDGTFAVEGMRYHMPGHWEMVVTVTRGETVEDAIFDFMVEE